MCSGIPDYILAEGGFSLEVSAEAAMVYMLSCALSHGGEWPDMLYAYPWFPRGLKGLGAEKRDARWSYLLRQEPEGQGIVYAPEGRHAYGREAMPRTRSSGIGLSITEVSK